MMVVVVGLLTLEGLAVDVMCVWRMLRVYKPHALGFKSFLTNIFMFVRSWTDCLIA
jgi:hypothetical protein